MASIVIRRLDDALKSKLQILAASNGRSMEEEAREILRAGLRPPSMPRDNLFDAIRHHIEPVGGVDLELAPREAIRRPPKFPK